MFSPLTAVLIQARQHEIEARAARAHHLDALRDRPAIATPPKRRPARHRPSLALFTSLVGRRA